MECKIAGAASKSWYLKEKIADMRTKAVPLLALFLLIAVPATAQLPTTITPQASSYDQQQQPAMAPPQMLPTDVFSGSGVVDKLVPGVVKLGILDAIDRGLKHNLGLLLSQQQTESARAQHRRSLSYLLPNISGNVNESVQQINLAAFGIPLPAGLTSPVIGPFGVFDAHAAMNETFLDFNALNRLRASTENEKTARFNLQDARELVVLVVGNEYLLTLADAARLDTAKAQLTTAQTIYQQTRDMKTAGVSAGIDVLRAQVQMQTQQQRVLAAQNQFEREKMTLARVIGVPVSQQFELTDKVAYAPLPPMNIEEALARAYQRRPEYLAGETRVRSAELAVKAAKGEALPTMQINGQYGVLGPTPGSAENVYSLAAGVRIPVFQGGRVRADVAQAESDLRQSRMQLENLHSRVEFEVRSALLDVNTSNEQVAVARQSIDLAGQQLKEAQDRYAAGVSGTLEVVQSQEAVAAANETYIQALYLNNIAKLTLGRALGVGEQQTRAFLGGK